MSCPISERGPKNAKRWNWWFLFPRERINENRKCSRTRWLHAKQKQKKTFKVSSTDNAKYGKSNDSNAIPTKPHRRHLHAARSVWARDMHAFISRRQTERETTKQSKQAKNKRIYCLFSLVIDRRNTSSCYFFYLLYSLCAVYRAESLKYKQKNKNCKNTK